MLRKRGVTLRHELLQFILLGWFIPLIVIIIVMIFYVSARVSRQAERTLTISMDKASELVEYSLMDCISESRDASYLSTVKQSYSDYKKTGNMGNLRSMLMPFLEEHYKFNPSFNRTVLEFGDLEGQLFYTQNESAKKHLVAISTFRDMDLPVIRERAKDLGTGIAFMGIEGRVYMVRNIVDRSFTPMAVLVMELDTGNVFGSLRSIPEYINGKVYLEGEVLVSDGDTSNEGKKNDFVRNEIKVEGNVFDFEVRYDREALLVEQRSMQYFFILLIIFMIILVLVMFNFFNTRVSEPISELKEASEMITEGKYGHKVMSRGQNKEIAELTENFNHMSEKLDEQFNKIFLEEIALRDANIHALQSQINPHFLNNTLEIINWEAKLSGNDKVGKMIEALATMMSATMNRDKRTVISLEEELSYVRAFIYIVSCRYEEKFSYEEQVDESLLNVKIPRLLIQPVVENAVEYGADPGGNRYVGLFITSEEDNVIVKVVNHGVPTGENLERIRALLSEETGDETMEKGIGIRNVNQRIKMMYGEEYGLSITPDANGDTISTILVKK